MFTSLLPLLFHILTPLPACAEELPVYRSREGNTEFIMRGEMMSQDETLGRVPNRNPGYDLVKMEGGKEISHTTCHLDKNGFRLNSATGLPGKKKHLLLIDGSTIFGDGLQDDQTIAYLVNKRSKTYEAYAVAFATLSIQHAWVRFKEGILKRQIPFKKGRAILWIGTASEGRLFGTLHDLRLVEDFPYVTERPGGGFELQGTFGKNGKWWQRLLLRYCVPFTSCKNLLALGDNLPDDEQLAFEGRMIDDIEKMYREQFDVEDFWVLWQSELNLEAIRRLTKAKVILIPEIERHDDHPTAAGAQQIANFLFQKGIAE